MKDFLSAAGGKVAWIILATIAQVFGGVSLGIVVVMGFAFFIMVGPGLNLLPGQWQCSARQVKTITLLDADFDIDSEECTAGSSYAQTTTAINASRPGYGSSTKIFEFLAHRRGYADLGIEQVDAHTIRIIMPPGDGVDTRYMGLHKWESVTLLYDRTRKP